MDGLTHARHKALIPTVIISLLLTWLVVWGLGAKLPAASIGLGGSGVKSSDADQISAMKMLVSLFLKPYTILDNVITYPRHIKSVLKAMSRRPLG